jgi:hypothetical protein
MPMQMLMRPLLRRLRLLLQRRLLTKHLQLKLLLR